MNKKKVISTMVILLLFVFQINAQAYFETEYIGVSSFRDENNQKLGDSEGKAIVYQGGVKLPIFTKINEKKQPVIWGIGLNGAYASLDNKNFTEDIILQEILNLQLDVFHMRPLNEKWSLISSIGVGVYTSHTRISDIEYENVLGSLGVLFIRHLKPNLEIGGGLAINNTFGFPMVFPALYFNWNHDGAYKFKVSMMNGIELSAGYEFSDGFDLNLVGDISGQGALYEKDGTDLMFSHLYIVGGLRPVIHIKKTVSVPVTLGVSAIRGAYSDERTLKAMFNSRENDPHFGVAPYGSIALEVEF